MEDMEAKEAMEAEAEMEIKEDMARMAVLDVCISFIFESHSIPLPYTRKWRLWW